MIVDIVFERRDCFESAERLLCDLDRCYVAVTCELAELDRREAARGNRPVGLARRQRLHDARYVLHVDTTSASVADCAARVAALLG